ncbi:MAG: M23 family metallopeptidase [Alphaproteobacteria bacterium]|nr:MAG: M23 family metallopeptidase [Alphaproteobacteria bacterium]
MLLVAGSAQGGAALELAGRLTQGGLLIGRVAPGARVRLDGDTVRVAPDGRFVIGFGRDAPPAHMIEVTQPDGGIERHRLEVALRQYRIERVDGLPEKTVTLPPEYRARRARETSMVRKARAIISDRLDWEQGFILPARGRISGVYGSQRILNGKPRWPHYGLDVAAPTGTPVVAPAGGIVRLAEPDFLLEGGILVIDHGFGVSSTLMHLSRIDVAVGEEVKKGQQVGAIGATGRATGPHVDWRINWRAVRLDPGLVVDLPAGAGTRQTEAR